MPFFGSSSSINGQTDIEIIKYDVNGNLLWESRYDGGSFLGGTDDPKDIKVDKNGNVYVTGFSDRELISQRRLFD